MVPVGVVKDFKDFALSGNLLQTAIGIVVGLAVVALITAFVGDIITPLISVPGNQNLGSAVYRVGNGVFLQGAFLNAIISFLSIMLVIFFVLVRPVAKYEARKAARKAAAPPTTKVCPFCISQVPIPATRCMYCTSQLTV
ncbi:MAG: MscL family protein [Thermoplasmata archaeon]|nr:MscL family protein [Thermoplasmata archaeon]